MVWNESTYTGLIPRVKTMLADPANARRRVLHYSADLDQYLDADNPVDNPITTVRQEIEMLGVVTHRITSDGIVARVDISDFLELSDGKCSVST